jgi:hypothetical protein
MLLNAARLARNSQVDAELFMHRFLWTAFAGLLSAIPDSNRY